MAIEILYSCSKGIHNHYAKKNRVEKINVRNEYTYPFMAHRLKCYSNIENMDLEKIDLKGNVFYKDFYALYDFMKYIPDKKCYEVFVSLNDSKNVAGSLLYKTFKNKFIASLYYRLLDYIISHKGISTIESIIERYS